MSAMPDWRELFDSRQVSVSKSGLSTVELYHADTFDPYALYLSLPTIGSKHPSLHTFLSNAEVRPIEKLNESGVPGYCEVELTYDPPEVTSGTNDNSETWVWENLSQTTHIDSVPDTEDQLSWDAEHPEGANLTTVLGQDGDNVKGADVYRPTGALRVSKYYDRALITPSFRKNLYNSQNHVNESAWKDWEKGEILFLGSRIQFDLTQATAQVDFNFLYGVRKSGVSYKVFIDEPRTNLAFISVDLKSATFPGDDYV